MMDVFDAVGLVVSPGRHDDHRAHDRRLLLQRPEVLLCLRLRLGAVLQQALLRLTVA